MALLYLLSGGTARLDGVTGMVMERMRLIGGRLIDPSQGVDDLADVVVGSGRVLEIVRGTERSRRSAVASGERLVDVEGIVIAPGFVDLHCHLREPGFEEKETIASGHQGGGSQGFTTICAMPNTNPTVDTASDVEWVTTAARWRRRPGLPDRHHHPRREGPGAVGDGRHGPGGPRSLLRRRQHGQERRLMRNALAYSRVTGRLIVDHAEDPDLVDGGVMHDGRLPASSGFGAAEAEEVAVARDIALARATGGRPTWPISRRRRPSTWSGQEVRGVSVTAEVTPTTTC